MIIVKFALRFGKINIFYIQLTIENIKTIRITGCNQYLLKINICEFAQGNEVSWVNHNCIISFIYLLYNMIGIKS